MTLTLPELLTRYARCADVAIQEYPLLDLTVNVMGHQSLCDLQAIDRRLMPQLRRLHEQGQLTDPVAVEDNQTLGMTVVSNRDGTNLDALVFGGSAIVALSAPDLWFAVPFATLPHRDTEETNIEVSIRGPKDGLVESLHTNLGLIRLRLPIPSVSVRYYTIGTKTKTKVALLFEEGRLHPDTLRLIDERLTAVQQAVEEVFSASQLEEMISDHPHSIFPLTAYSGRPDFIAACLLKGRFAILIEGVPGAMIAPASLLLLIKTPEDSHFNYLSASFGRLLRIACLLLSIYLPSFYVALIGYHQDQIPFPLLATISVSRFGVPFTTPIEMFVVLFLLETFKEAGFRLPSSIGQTLTVVGGLIIGEAAIRAGLTSPSMVVISAISVVAGSTLVSQTLTSTVSLLRYGALLVGSLLGMYGFLLSILFVTVYLAGLTSFGVPYLAPLTPITIKDVMRSLLLLPRNVHAFVPVYLSKRKRADRP